MHNWVCQNKCSTSFRCACQEMSVLLLLWYFDFSVHSIWLTSRYNRFHSIPAKWLLHFILMHSNEWNCDEHCSDNNHNNPFRANRMRSQQLHSAFSLLLVNFGFIFYSPSQHTYTHTVAFTHSSWLWLLSITKWRPFYLLLLLLHFILLHIECNYIVINYINLHSVGKIRSWTSSTATIYHTHIRIR